MGSSLEVGDIDAKKRRRKNYWIKGLIISTVVIAALWVFPRNERYQNTIGVGETWQQENLRAPFQFAIRKAESELEAEKAAVRAETPPIFYEYPQAVDDLDAKSDSILARMSHVFDTYTNYQLNLLRGRLDQALADSIAYIAAKDSLSYRFSDAVWQTLLQSHANSVPGLIATSRSREVGNRLDAEILAEAKRQSLLMLESGVMDLDRNTILSNQLTKRTRTSESVVPVAAVFDLSEARDIGLSALSRKWPNNPTNLAIATAFYHDMVIASLRYDRTESEARWMEKEALISPNIGLVRENELIVRQGDLVTEEIEQKLVSLDLELTERSGGKIVWKTVLGHFILTFATFLIFFLYLFLLRRPIFDDNKMVFLIVLLFLGVIAVYGIALRAALLDMYVVPVAIVAILLTVIFDSRVALFGALTMALLGSHFLNYNFAFTFSTMFASTLGIFSVRDIRNRGQFFISASIVFIGYLTVISANYLLQNTPIDRLTDEVMFVAINSILMLLAYPALWIFERAFGVTTDLTLLELSDTNRPLLKELSLKAPGTFNHVLQVANLAEAAAAAIGANALLTRVGALYHDVGKMVKPEYFVENQRGGFNPHDDLKPRMSALIIASHVKEGIDLAKRFRLPKEVQDFIPMHHGTTRIEYFYHRAKAQRKEGDSDILESEFRYPGPKPASKETSILMLADSVEAASRSMVNPSHKRLQALIDSIVDARREDGQLDHTDLTFSDINQIKESLLNILMGVYHVRVKYPGEDRVEGEKPKEGLTEKAADTSEPAENSDLDAENNESKE